jgi:amino acid transporter
MDETANPAYACGDSPARKEGNRVEGSTIAAAGAAVDVAPGDKGLKKGVISSISNIVIGVASTAPGYSLAATLGLIVGVGGIGLQSPAVMIVAFIPMLCIAAAYYYMNRADPDCGTTFTWVTRAMGPRSGWLAGWAIIAADVLVMPSLAYVAGQYSFQLFGMHSAANSKWAVFAVGVAWIVVMTWICWVGVELSARTQRILLSIEVFTLGLFAVVALIKVYANHPAHSIKPAFSWFNPLDISSLHALTGGVLLAIFIYWGWDSGVAVNEESEDASEGPGRSAIISTVLLVLIYVLVTTAAQAYGGPKLLIDNSSDVFAPLGKSVLGSGLDKLLIIAVLTSASASTQTTILPTARTALSMARNGALPKIFGRIHPRFLTPDVSTIGMGLVSAIVFGFLTLKNKNLISDAFTALGLMIAFYYGLTGFACTIFYRRQLFKSVKNFIFMGVLPTAGGVMLGWVFVRSVMEIKKKTAGYAPAAFGVGSPFIIAVIVFVLGAVLLVWSMRKYPAFFRRKPEVVDAESLAHAPVSAPAPR